MKYFSLIVITILISSCGSKYGKAYSYNSAGYKEKRMSYNMFEVTYNGSFYGDLTKAIDFCLLRCAEITLERGFTYFTVPHQESGMWSYLTKNPDLYGTVGGNPVVLEGAYTTDTPRAVAQNLIVCYNKKPDRPLTYNASTTIKNIKSRYNL